MQQSDVVPTSKTSLSNVFPTFYFKRLSVNMYVCMYACIFVCLYMYVCMYACMHACMYVHCMLAYMHMFAFFSGFSSGGIFYDDVDSAKNNISGSVPLGIYHQTVRETISHI